MERYIAYAEAGFDTAISWLLSIAAWGQAAMILIAFGLAFYISKILSRILTPWLTPPESSETLLSKVRVFARQFLPLLLPLLCYAMLGTAEQIAANTFGASEVIGLGKRLCILLATWILATKIIYAPLPRLIAKYALLPIALLYTLGLWPLASEWLINTRVAIGSIGFSLMDVVSGLIFGGFLFWLGSWSNTQSATLIESQKEMKKPVRALASKAAELLIFATCFFLLLNIMGIPLSGLAVFGGAIGLGLGFGLQKIASNFISGIILLLEGQATIGDFVELDGGEAGTIVKMMSRATILETFDGKWIVVPNEDFITTRITNYSDAGSGNRYEANFSVSYDTDINLIPDIIQQAVSAHPDVLQTPEPPDCELRGFGDSGIDFCVEFWVNGIDDGKNKYTSDVLFLIWNALKDNNIEIPYPHQVVEFKQPSKPK
ncbi:hypothetical protein GCM10007939_16820 [Amylibacter marinus]|uniref:Mechanosensitive ion channel n=1 Tax=Amylibacter marinus TaxID=1475483 RepID=A0ABQ5VW36_9RHOB|nr:mechanosensitive ion channel domain-containing protein [Amylibacter marinus]GLQ35399.1 hypothetical protein GCM10007939_16820 [Amylibacter marinus]